MPPEIDSTLLSMQQTIAAMREDLRRMANTIEVVGRLEERIGWMTQAVNGQTAEIRALDTRMRVLENAAPQAARTVTLVERALWALAMSVSGGWNPNSVGLVGSSNSYL